MRNTSLGLCIGAIALMLLGGCVSGKPQSDTYTSKSGTVTTIETDRESCIRSCNDDYARCNDMTSSQLGKEQGVSTSDIFGAKADCRVALKKCLPQCKGR